MENFLIIAGFAVLIFLNSRWKSRFELLSENLYLLSMATDRLENEIGTAKEGEREVNEYLKSKLGAENESISSNSSNSALLEKIQVLLASQADIHKCVRKLANPEIWQNGVPLTQDYDRDNFSDLGFYNDTDPKSPFFNEHELIFKADINNDGEIFLNDSHCRQYKD